MFFIADFERKRKSQPGKLAYNLKIRALGCGTVWIGNATVSSKIRKYLPVDLVSKYMEISQPQMSQWLIICLSCSCVLLHFFDRVRIINSD